MIDAALNGETGLQIGSDYTRGMTGKDNIVLSAYAPLELGDTTWALVAEIDRSEAFAAANQLKAISAIVFLIGLAAVIFVAPAGGARGGQSHQPGHRRGSVRVPTR